MVGAEVVTGKKAIQMVNVLKTLNLNPQMVITLVDREQGGMEAITKQTGVRAISVFKFSELPEFAVDDHVLFMAAPGDGAPEGTYLMFMGRGQWEPCSPQQNEYLHQNPGNRIKYEGDTSNLGGAEEAGDVFYIEGVLRP